MKLLSRILFLVMLCFAGSLLWCYPPGVTPPCQGKADCIVMAKCIAGKCSMLNDAGEIIERPTTPEAGPAEKTGKKRQAKPQ